MSADPSRTHLRVKDYDPALLEAGDELATSWGKLVVTHQRRDERKLLDAKADPRSGDKPRTLSYYQIGQAAIAIRPGRVAGLGGPFWSTTETANGLSAADLVDPDHPASASTVALTAGGLLRCGRWPHASGLLLRLPGRDVNLAGAARHGGGILRERLAQAATLDGPLTAAAHLLPGANTRTALDALWPKLVAAHLGLDPSPAHQAVIDQLAGDWTLPLADLRLVLAELT